MLFRTDTHTLLRFSHHSSFQWPRVAEVIVVVAVVIVTVVYRNVPAQQNLKEISEWLYFDELDELLERISPLVIFKTQRIKPSESTQCNVSRLLETYSSRKLTESQTHKRRLSDMMENQQRDVQRETESSSWYDLCRLHMFRILPTTVFSWGHHAHRTNFTFHIWLVLKIPVINTWYSADLCSYYWCYSFLLCSSNVSTAWMINKEKTEGLQQVGGSCETTDIVVLVWFCHICSYQRFSASFLLPRDSLQSWNH